MAIRQTRDLERVLQAAADRGDVSSILLVPDEPVCFRVEGDLERLDGDAWSAEQIHDLAAAAIGQERLTEVGADVGQLMTSCSLAGVLDGRMCVSHARDGYSIAIHVLPTADLAGLAARIGVPDALVDAALATWGLVLIAGPAGSGKTTTQYALLEEINRRRACHICTVEYMIGMRLPAKRSVVQQREVGIDVPDAVSGIAAAMGQGLDVLLVGELRTAEELEASVRVAYHGHLVITQLHTPTPEATLTRAMELVDATTRGQLATSLRAVSAHRLLPRADGAGRVAATALLLPDDAIRQAIREGREIPPTSPSLEDDIARLVREGLVTEDAARDARARG